MRSRGTEGLLLPLGEVCSHGSAGGRGCSLGVSLNAAMLLSMEAVTKDFKPGENHM